MIHHVTVSVEGLRRLISTGIVGVDALSDWKLDGKPITTKRQAIKAFDNLTQEGIKYLNTKGCKSANPDGSCPGHSHPDES